MFYRLLADLVVLTHFAFIAFVVAGGLLVLRWHWVIWGHLPAAVWGAAIEFFGWYCPLTTVENSLRELSGAAGYSGGFIERYVIPIIQHRRAAFFCSTRSAGRYECPCWFPMCWYHLPSKPS